MSFLTELKRRNVFKVAAAYLALGWVVVQVTDTLAPVFRLPESTLPLVTWIGVIGFPFVVAFSWAFELTPEGLKRESEIDRSQSITHVTGRRLDYIIIALLVVAIGLFAADRFVPRAQLDAAPSVATDLNDTTEVTSAHAAAPAPSTAPNEKSIAVLPFVDMSAEKNQEYMSDGMAEELLNLLAKVPELKVIARTSSFAFKGEKIEIAEIAKRLNVAHVLEGSVRTSGKKIRITAQLIRAADSRHLWSETFDRPLDDIFAVQDEIAAAVVDGLKIHLMGDAPKAPTTDPAAYASFLQARAIGRQYTKIALNQSISMYEKALAIDPAYGAAWVGLAATYLTQAVSGHRTPEESFRLARKATNRALALDPQSAEVHAILGWMAIDHDRDLAAAARHLARAWSLEPNNASIINFAGVLIVGSCDLMRPSHSSDSRSRSIRLTPTLMMPSATPTVMLDALRRRLRNIAPRSISARGTPVGAKQ